VKRVQRVVIIAGGEIRAAEQVPQRQTRNRIGVGRENGADE